MIDFANKAVTFSSYLAYWSGNENELRNKALAISFFVIVPLVVNTLTVRKYGELEFVLTVIKLYAILALVVIAVVIATGGSPSPRLGTDGNLRVVDCVNNNATVAACVPAPGIQCKNLCVCGANMQIGLRGLRSPHSQKGWPAE